VQQPDQTNASLSLGEISPLHPGEAQKRAADPAASVWVSASAGTGKTKVLTDRVLSILLAGTAPHRLLCLTFTKAAAAEMANRLAAKLAHWTALPDETLRQELAQLVDDPNEALLVRARRLFALVLEAPGGMKIQTIHAFCQSLLRRFPLEAGLAPHFEIMDDRDAGEILAAAQEEVMTRARQETDPDLAAALRLVTGRVHEVKFPELLAEISAERGRLRRMILRENGLEGLITALRHHLGLAPGDSEASLLAQACREKAFQGGDLRRALPALERGAKTDKDRAQTLALWLSADEAERGERFEDYQGVFLTRDSGIRARLCTKDAKAALPDLEEILLTEAQRLLRIAQRRQAAKVAEGTAALLTLANALLGAYQSHKERRARLDYDDLILTARQLLTAQGKAAWVLYKLDGGLDHVLIDEAQDTNPDQWALVAALTEEFFTGLGASEAVRTVFAVGDAKQSIYSFQRADPREFEAMRRNFAAKVPAAEQLWREVPLQISFRSTRAILQAVDGVFAQGPGGDGVRGEDGSYAAHHAFRREDGGLVELWPPVDPREADAPEAWKPPVERIKGDSPRARLAALMARRIAAMVGSEKLLSKDRPIRAGDIMVLLRRRGAFVEDLVRELKRLGVPVAGTDRMVLTEQLAVMDLMALGQFLLLPEDDLTLAVVLKSPLVGLSEDELFTLAHQRQTPSLWAALTAQAGEAPYDAAYRLLADLRGKVDYLTPHDLYADLLIAGKGKAKLLARLGREAEDPLDEFMALTLAYERGYPPSLQGFLHWLESGAVEIKRDLEVADAVRIMTVHGSKGLQAPIVFLPDTLQTPQQGGKLVWLEPEEGGAEWELMSWPGGVALDPATQAGRDRAKLAREREYRRLLYVAMTRAEDRLYICGWNTAKAAPEGCWYNLIAAALKTLGESCEDPFLAQQGETASATLWRLTCPQTREVRAQTSADERAQATTLPPWAEADAPTEPAPPKPLAPSRPDGEEPPAVSPLARATPSRWQRGKLVHRLLQTLPDLPPAQWSEAAARFLAQPAWELEAASRSAIAAEALEILRTPAFAPLFQPGSRAEVPIVGLVGDRVVSGLVDRLVVGEKEVLIADYKTNRRPPRSLEDTPTAYIRQMAAYRLALACIYPDRAIRCALIWTDGAKLMEVPGAVMDDALSLE